MLYQGCNELIQQFLGQDMEHCTDCTNIRFHAHLPISTHLPCASADFTESRLTSQPDKAAEKLEPKYAKMIRTSEVLDPWVSLGTLHQSQEVSPDDGSTVGPRTKVCSSRFPSSLLFWSAHLRASCCSKFSSKKTLQLWRRAWNSWKTVEQISQWLYASQRHCPKSDPQDRETS